MPRWWVGDAQRWDREQRELADADIRFRIDDKALAAGKLVLALELEIDGQPLRLTAHFPTHYPYFPPMVVAPDLDLERHQTPGTKQLCLLGQGGEAWAPASDTLAGLLRSQLPRVFASQPGGAADDGTEEAHEGVPITGFLSVEESSFVGFPSFSFDRLAAHGTFRMGLDGLKPLRGTVLEITDSDGMTVATSETRNEAYYAARRAPLVTGRWVRLEKRPPATDAKHYYEIAIQALATLEQPRWEPLPGHTKPRIDLLALLFEDELVWQGRGGNVIVVSKTIEQHAQAVHGKVEPRLHRAELESRQNYFMRDPLAQGLEKATVSIAGAGSVGSPAAKFLAQAGIGQLRIVDQDVLDAGNAIRWEIGRSGAGQPKAHVLHQFIDANFPYTKVIGVHAKIGNPITAGSPQDQELDDHLFRKVTCVLDATASIPVNQFLSEMARLQGVPYIWMHSTNGAWGGLVGVAGPRREDFCWMCHLFYLKGGQIEALAAAPEEDVVQLPGCLDSTFVGSQVDLTEVSLMGARRVMQEVLAQVDKAETERTYPWNIATLRLRDEHGRPQLPVWTPYQLPPHAECPNH